jgi:hypothetical protein
MFLSEGRTQLSDIEAFPYATKALSSRKGAWRVEAG